jgi:hypothetical protein
MSRVIDAKTMRLLHKHLIYYIHTTTTTQLVCARSLYLQTAILPRQRKWVKKRKMRSDRDVHSIDAVSLCEKWQHLLESKEKERSTVNGGNVSVI